MIEKITYKDVTIVIVIFNVTDVIFECLKNLKDFSIIIVDNGKCDQKLVKKLKDYKNIKKYFIPKKNLGFARANNFAFKYVNTPYTLLINADIIIKNEDILNLIKIIKQYPDTGIAVPTLIDKNFKNIDKLELIPELGKGIVRSNFENNISYRLHQALLSGDACINFSWGAIMLLNNKIFKEIGLFDKKYFLYWEDYDLCRKLYKYKIPLIKTTSSNAYHLISSSVKKNIINYFNIQMFHILSGYKYGNLDKKSKYLYKKALIYLFRTFSYLAIFNIKKSTKNLARLCATIKYKFN